MSNTGIELRRAHSAPFHNYRLAEAYDEMFDVNGEPRVHYRELYESLLELPADELRRRKQASDRTFLDQGITFTVYGREEGTERIFPHDLLPRIITAQEWATIERGLIQRITALNLFLKDIYHEGKILNDGGVVPRRVVYRRASISAGKCAASARLGTSTSPSWVRI